MPIQHRLMAQWCADATTASQAEGGPAYGFVYVDQESFEKHAPQDFAALMASFTEYQETAQ